MYLQLLVYHWMTPQQPEETTHAEHNQISKHEAQIQLNQRTALETQTPAILTHHVRPHPRAHTNSLNSSWRP